MALEMSLLIAYSSQQDNVVVLWGLVPIALLVPHCSYQLAAVADWSLVYIASPAQLAASTHRVFVGITPTPFDGVTNLPGLGRDPNRREEES